MANTLLAVPNVSVMDGGVLSSLPSRGLLDAHHDKDHGRAVITHGGDPESITRDCLGFMNWAVANLGLRGHRGSHPRFGVVDVLPIVAYRSAEGLAIEVAQGIASAVWESLNIPVHLYDLADAGRRSLPELRRYLRSTPHEKHPSAGVVCIGVRNPLVAFNVNFRGDLGVVRRVARETRQVAVRALGFQLPSRGLVQVSMNLIAPDRVGPKAVFDRVVSLAHDLELVDCEVVGLVPHPILTELDGLPLRKPARSIEQALEEKGLL